MPVQFYMIVNSYSAMLAVQDDRGNICKVSGPQPEPAVSRPLTVEELSARLQKTGGTCYACAKVRAVVEPGLSLSASAINAMRREALAELTALRGRREQAPLGRFTRPMLYLGFSGKPRLTVQVATLEQITPKLLAMRPELLYLPVHLAAEAARRWPELSLQGKLGVVLPRIIQDRELAGVVRMLDESYDAGARFALVGNLGQLSVARSRTYRAAGLWPPAADGHGKLSDPQSHRPVRLRRRADKAPGPHGRGIPHRKGRRLLPQCGTQRQEAVLAGPPGGAEHAGPLGPSPAVHHRKRPGDGPDPGQLDLRRRL